MSSVLEHFQPSSSLSESPASTVHIGPSVTAPPPTQDEIDIISDINGEVALFLQRLDGRREEFETLVQEHAHEDMKKKKQSSMLANLDQIEAGIGALQSHLTHREKMQLSYQKMRELQFLLTQWFEKYAHEAEILDGLLKLSQDLKDGSSKLKQEIGYIVFLCYMHVQFLYSHIIFVISYKGRLSGQAFLA